MIAEALLLACLAVGVVASGAMALAGVRARPRAPVDVAGAVAGAMLALACAAAGASVLGV
ncbi:protein of unknown function [Methylorubrum extorquens]|uniref:Uncharacterized protein n=1 Tax=Methylorubrum extorquens TaxID=408 RepID=A0A2N9ATL8_METEX|nr:protein of unknown function [Methylorubrum extorquens]